MIRICLVLTVCLLPACADPNSDQNLDKWHPGGANAANIAAMAANPHDMILGRGARGADARPAASAVERVWLDHAKPLPDANGSASAAAPAAAN
jgi:hypothetical protein